MVIALQTVLWRCSFPPDVCINGRPPPFSFHCIEQYCSHVVTQLSATSKHSTRRENTSVRAARENISVTQSPPTDMGECNCIKGFFFFPPSVQPDDNWGESSTMIARGLPELLCYCARRCYYHRIGRGSRAEDITSSLRPHPNQTSTQSPLFHHADMTVPFPRRWNTIPQLTEDETRRTGREEVSPRSVSGKNINSVFKSHSNNHRSYRDTDFSSL